MGYRRQALIGVSWVGLMRLFIRGAGFLRTIVLARLLSPDDFGLFGIAVLLLGLIEMLTETGINVFLIQEKGESALKKYLNTAYVVSILRGGLIALIIVLLSPLTVNFFRRPEAIGLVLLTALVPLFRGFINPALVAFQKRLEFNRDFFFRSAIILVEAIATISIALYTRSPISLVLGLIISAAFEVALSHRLIKPRPKLRFDPDQFKAIIDRGKWVAGGGVFMYFAQKTPDFSIGRLIDTLSLGHYQMAYRLAVMPVEETVDVFNRVAFPIYTQIGGDSRRLKKAVLKNYAAVLSLAVALSLAIWFLAGPVVRLGLGEQWLPIIPLLKLMGVAALITALNTPTNSLFAAVKKQQYITYAYLALLVVILLTIFPLIGRFGVAGGVYSFILGQLAALPVRFYLTWRVFRDTESKRAEAEPQMTAKSVVS